MADQKRWFKVWTSILLDPGMNSLELADVGRWVRLGALAAAVGDRGQLSFPAAGDGLVATLKVGDLIEAKRVLARLPNLVLSDAPVAWPHGHGKALVCAGAAWRGGQPANGRCSDPFEEWCTRYATFFVTFENWNKYQDDTTAAERGKRLRSKRRGEEKRGEEKRIPPTIPPHEDLPVPANILSALDRTQLLGQVLTLRGIRFWRATIRATNGHVDYPSEILKAEAWLSANPTRAPRKDLSRFLHNWLARAGERA